MTRLLDALTAPASDDRIAEIADIRLELQRHDVDQKGLRLDTMITNPYNNKVLWIDATAACTISSSRLEAELNYHKKRSEQFAQGKNAREVDDAIGKFGPTLRGRNRDKHKKYKPLITAAKRLHETGKLPYMPSFVAAVVSTLGEFGEGALKAQEFIVNIAKSFYTSQQPSEDGITAAVKIRNFRKNLNRSLLVNVARGTARVKLTAGQPSYFRN
jgi:hypothetical protein